MQITHAELAELMALGYGVWKHEPSHSGICYTTYKFNEEDWDKEVGINSEGQKILIRRFHDIYREGWHEPTLRDLRDYEEELERKYTRIIDPTWNP